MDKINPLIKQDHSTFPFLQPDYDLSDQLLSKRRSLQQNFQELYSQPIQLDKPMRKLDSMDAQIKSKKSAGSAKKFRCDVLNCDKIFKTKYSLKRHMKVHKTIKDYVCDKCGKGFALQQYLIEHDFTHTGLKPYKCGIGDCQETFRQRGKRSLHQAQVHNKNCNKKKGQPYIQQAHPFIEQMDPHINKQQYIADNDSEQLMHILQNRRTSENIIKPLMYQHNQPFQQNMIGQNDNNKQYLQIQPEMPQQMTISQKQPDLQIAQNQGVDTISQHSQNGSLQSQFSLAPQMHSHYNGGGQLHNNQNDFKQYSSITQRIQQGPPQQTQQQPQNFWQDKEQNNDSDEQSLE